MAAAAAAALLLSPIENHLPFKPEPTSYIPLLEKCSNTKLVRQIHAQMIKTGLIHQTIPCSKLLTALCKHSQLTYSLHFFDTIQEPNTFMWNTVIRAFANSQQNREESILLYCRMLYNAAPHNLYTFPFLIKATHTLDEIHQLHCHVIKFGFASDLHASNSLLNAYAKSGCGIQTARRFFDQMEEKNVVSWTSMINGYAVNCLFKESLKLFHEMQEREIQPDKVTLACALSSCAELGALDQGRWVHAYIKKKRIQSDQVLGCALIDMYAKCGELNEAVTTFEDLKEGRCVSTWTAMITGFAVHGRGREALHLFENMEKNGTRPNEITFTGVLAACSYSGLVEEGKFVFDKMINCYNIRPSIEHYGCMVDLFGRAGLFKEVEELIESMPMKPNAAVWGALLSSCLVHRDYERGVRVGEMLITLEPDHGGRYVNLANIYAAKGEWNQAAKVRKMMREKHVSKLPGSSLVVLDGRVHEFLAGDKSRIEWSRILVRLKEEGYIAETENLLLDLEEEEKETAVNCHSEKLAIAFGLTRSEPGSTIHVIKNLRVCRDCHNVSKLISKVYDRKIVMRDRSRYHIFKDGHCSCRDYW